jgi:hypothetical protein
MDLLPARILKHTLTISAGADERRVTTTLPSTRFGNVAPRQLHSTSVIKSITSRSAASLFTLISLAFGSPAAVDEPLVPGAEQRLVVSGQGFFPVALRLQDGRIAVVLRGGADHVGIKGRLDIVFSDDGKSWTQPALVVDSPVDDRNPAFGQALDGTLVVAFWRSAKDTYKDYERDDATQPVNTWVTRSSDGGKSWSEPSEIDVRDIGYGSPYGKMLTLPDGTMLMNIYGYEPREPGSSSTAKEDHSYLYRSSDHGKTWKRHAVIGRKFNETGLLRTPDGTLLAALRSAGDKANVSLTRSVDGGGTWSAPQPISPQWPIPPTSLCFKTDEFFSSSAAVSNPSAFEVWCPTQKQCSIGRTPSCSPAIQPMWTLDTQAASCSQTAAC